MLTPTRSAVGWADLLTFDLQASCLFYSDLFGWSYYKQSDAYILALGDEDHPVAGFLRPAAPKQGETGAAPNAWLPYFMASAIEDIAEKASRLGGEHIYGPRVLPNRHQAIIVRDPDGATLGASAPSGKEAGRASSETGAAKGHARWSKLVSATEEGIAFYESLFGWTCNREVRNEVEHVIFKKGSEPVASALTAREDESQPPFWMLYWEGDPADCAERTEDEGGRIHVPPQTTDANTFCVLEDPGGAIFAVVSPRA